MTERGMKMLLMTGYLTGKCFHNANKQQCFDPNTSSFFRGISPLLHTHPSRIISSTSPPPHSNVFASLQLLSAITSVLRWPPGLDFSYPIFPAPLPLYAITVDVHNR